MSLLIVEFHEHRAIFVEEFLAIIEILFVELDEPDINGLSSEYIHFYDDFFIPLRFNIKGLRLVVLPHIVADRIKLKVLHDLA